MKKISHRARLLLVRRSRRILAQITRWNTPRSRRPRRRAGKEKTLIIKAPRRIVFLDEHDRHLLFDFLTDVNERLQTGRRIVIDFSETTGLHPCGTIIFMAHLDGWLHAYPSQLTCTYPEDDVVEQLLQHVEVLSRLGLPARKAIEHQLVKYWHYHSGNNVDSATYKQLTQSVRDGIVHPNKELFADCLNEAVVNTVNHAYKYQSVSVVPKQQQKWWMFSLLMDEQLFVSIYDRGVGIPVSLRRKPEWKQYLKIRQYKDSRMIQAAVSTPLTSTKLPERGLGLPEMLDFSKSLVDGGLSIFSRNGGVTYNAKFGAARRQKLPIPLPGTLVLWSIPFRKEQSHANDNDINRK